MFGARCTMQRCGREMDALDEPSFGVLTIKYDVLHVSAVPLHHVTSGSTAPRPQ